MKILKDPVLEYDLKLKHHIEEYSMKLLSLIRGRIIFVYIIVLSYFQGYYSIKYLCSTMN